MEERQSSSQTASTSQEEGHGSDSHTPATLLTSTRALLLSKHDAMIFNLAAPSLLALAADPLLAITGINKN
jgi:hypothetical protein